MRRSVPGSTANNPNHEHPRVQRWRASVQRELSRNMAVEVAYNGSRGDLLERNIRQDYLPEQWFNSSNVRDVTQQNLLNANVTNPFFINNFEPLRTSNPTLYNQMARNSFFTSPTIQRHRLLRPFPHMSSGDGLEYRDLQVGANRAHSLEVNLQRRFANGFMASLFYTATRLREKQNRRGVRTRADHLPIDSRGTAAPGDGGFHRRAPVRLLPSRFSIRGASSPPS